MKEFDYDLDYKRLDFTDEENRKLYRIGRGEQGVLLVRPYTDDICAHWRFKTPEIAKKNLLKSMKCILIIVMKKILSVWICVVSFLEMGFTRSRRYANHRDGKKYDKEGNIIPQEKDHATCHFAKSATIFKKTRDVVAKNETYVKMRKQWRSEE